jgi:hypothetical protein
MKTQDAYGTFDFGLTEEQDALARDIHRRSVVLDMAFQGPISPDAWTDALRAEVEAAMRSPDDYCGVRGLHAARRSDCPDRG